MRAEMWYGDGMPKAKFSYEPTSLLPFSYVNDES